MKLYETYAEELAASIRQGVLKPGDRLPSVRAASTSRGVSPSTVFEAYYLLEARGLIRARALRLLRQRRRRHAPAGTAQPGNARQ